MAVTIGKPARCKYCNWSTTNQHKLPCSKHCVHCGQSIQFGECKCCGKCGKKLSKCGCSVPSVTAKKVIAQAVKAASVATPSNTYTGEITVKGDMPAIKEKVSFTSLSKFGYSSDVQCKPEIDYDPQGQFPTVMWGTRHNEMDLCQIASDYYILLAMRGNLIIGEAHDEYIRREAGIILKSLVEEYDRPLMNYIDMAIGGELRHHNAFRKHLSENRRYAWAVWHHIRARHGTYALSEASRMFLEFKGGSFGGKKWSDAALTLKSRVDGQITPELWIDRCLNLQHNGGCFFNKLKYGYKNVLGWGLYELQANILPQHGLRSPNWQELLATASDQVRDLFFEYWTSANYERLRNHRGGR